MASTWPAWPWETYEYDSAGQRIATTTVLGRSRLYYDQAGRITRSTTVLDQRTEVAYAWDATVLGAGSRQVGGWVKTTALPDGSRHAVDKSDVAVRDTTACHHAHRTTSLTAPAGRRLLSVPAPSSSIEFRVPMSTKTFWSALMSAATVMLCGCATPPSLQSAPPSTSPATGYMLHRSALLDVTDHMTKHLDNDKNIVYFQNFGGGGAGVGLLLGPLGVMANVSMIGSNTTKDAAQLKDRVAINPREIFAEAAARAGVDLSDDPHKLRITPYMLVSKTEGEVLLTSVAVIVESSGTTESKKWSGRYVIQLPHRFTVSTLATMDEAALQNLKAAAGRGFAKLLGRLTAEKDVAISKEPAIKLKSDLISPRFEHELLGSLVAEEEDFVWVRTVGGVFGVHRTNLHYTRQQVQAVAGSPAAAR